MAKAPLVPHYVTNAGTKYAISLPDIYSEIGTVVGVTKATGSETDITKGGSIAELTRQGIVERLKVRVKDSSGKRFYVGIVSAIEKVTAAEHGVATKNLGTKGVAVSATVPRRMRLG